MESPDNWGMSLVFADRNDVEEFIYRCSDPHDAYSFSPSLVLHWSQFSWF